MNEARTDPQRYADFLESCRVYYREGRLLQFPGQIALRTQEGVGALNEAIRDLRRTAPMAPLSQSAALDLSAGGFASEQAQTGGVGHYGRNGSTPFSRMARFGAWQSRAGEDVAYGYGGAVRIVMDLMIDDGVANRGHRHNILNPDFHVAGAGCNRHPRFGSVCVIDFAGGFTAN